MSYFTPNGFGLQSLLFPTADLSSCFFREPSERELEFMHYYQGVLDLLSADELRALGRYHRKGRVGYDLPVILGIMLLKLVWRQDTMKETLQLLQENGNLRDILGICEVPSQSTVSRLSRIVETIVQPTEAP